MIATCIWSYTPHTYYSPSVWNLGKVSDTFCFLKKDLLNQSESLLNYNGKKKKKSKTIGTTLL